MLGLVWQPFTEEEELRLINAIKDAERNTSGEIKVHIEKWCKTDPIYKAQNKFYHLKMEQTKLRNGVLFYIAIKEKKFAIVGDEGINAKVAENFWNEIKSVLQSNFSSGEVLDGLCKGISMAGEQLSTHFPYLEGDKNELSDDISYG